MSQERAKAFIPPQTYLWRANKVGAWHFNQPDFNRRGRAAWSQFGGSSLLALQDVCKRAWEGFLIEHRLPRAHCPIPGLLD
eukprot:9496898-Pyramimonas_sp.AAC.2